METGRWRALGYLKKTAALDLEEERRHKEGPASPIEDFKSWRLHRAGMPNTEWGKILREKGEDRSNQKGVLSGERKGTLRGRPAG